MAGAGVYFHIPFCERVCPYCDFVVLAVRVLSERQEDRYVSALCHELEMRAPAFQNLSVTSIYLGGGTPSLLRPESVSRLLDAVERALPMVGATEVTLEVNPSTVERTRLPGFRQAGVNRLSIGIQSFDDVVLKRLGRAHRAQEGEATLSAARSAGFDNLSVDLIHTVPGEDLEVVRRDVETLLTFQPEHVSAYGLTIEDGTPYARAVEQGRLQNPSESDAVAMLEEVWSSIEGAGYRHYEISSFARPGFESCHNRHYWARDPVLGLGIGAASLDPSVGDVPHGVRRQNPRSLEAYLTAVEEGLPVGVEEQLSEPEIRSELTFLALRTSEGLSARRFEKEFGKSPRHFYGDFLDEFISGGLLEESPTGDLRFTRRGMRVSDSVFVALM